MAAWELACRLGLPGNAETGLFFQNEEAFSDLPAGEVMPGGRLSDFAFPDFALPDFDFPGHVYLLAALGGDWRRGCRRRPAGPGRGGPDPRLRPPGSHPTHPPPPLKVACPAALSPFLLLSGAL